ncbi:MAG: tetratricopeptide repeat protein [Phycisphaerales bacterium]
MPRAAWVSVRAPDRAANARYNAAAARPDARDRYRAGRTRSAPPITHEDSDLAFFFSKKPDDPGKDDNGKAGNGEPFKVNAESARRFFDHARTVHETTNYEYAMQSWLNGLRHDPTSIEGLEGFFRSARQFAEENKKGASKDTIKQFAGRADLDRYLSALLDWGCDPLDSVSAVRATEYAARLGLAEQAYWLGDRALTVIVADRRPRKDLLVKLVDVFGSVNIWDLAVKALEFACRLDPSDGKLQAELRNLAAQATMSKGGYDKSGQAGGFRANVRDADKQRMLEEQDRVSRTDESIDRLLRAAEEDYQKRPDDPHAISLYLKRLLERGRPEDEKRAHNVAKEAYEKSKQFRFRQVQGDIVLRVAQRKLLVYKDAAAAKPQDANAQAQYRAALAGFAKMEIEEIRARVEAYPTDLGLKFELGKRYFDLERYEDAIGMFQEAKADAKHRVAALQYLAQAFQKIEWINEAVSTFRQARETYRVDNDDVGLNLQYGLMTALHVKAENERDLAAAEEADQLASAIAIQQINYKDIRARRDAIKKLLVDLRRGTTV